MQITTATRRVYMSILTIMLVFATTVATTFAWVGILTYTELGKFDINLGVEDVNNEYRKNINRDVITAYHKAVEYTINRIKNYCNSRNANYLLVQSDKSVNEVFLKNLPEMGVLK